MISEEKIKKALEEVKYPGFTRNIVSFGMVKKLEIKDSTVDLTLGLTTSDKTVAEQIRKDIETALRKVEGIKTLNLTIALQAPSCGGAQHRIRRTVCPRSDADRGNGRWRGVGSDRRLDAGVARGQ